MIFHFYKIILNQNRVRMAEVLLSHQPTIHFLSDEWKQIWPIDRKTSANHSSFSFEFFFFYLFIYKWYDNFLFDKEKLFLRGFGFKMNILRINISLCFYRELCNLIRFSGIEYFCSCENRFWWEFLLKSIRIAIDLGFEW